VRLVLVVLVAAFVVTSLWLFVFVPSDHLRHADVIVALAPSHSRIVEAEKLRREHVAPVVLVSLPPLSSSCPARTTCFHAHPYSTQGEAETVARIAHARGWTHVVIVSNTYHLRRARLLFGRCLHRRPAIVAAKTSVTSYVLNIPREWVKLTYQLTFDRGC